MSDILKIKYARVAATAAFWIAVGVLFLQSRGFSLAESYTLVSLYYFAVVLLEFPTGVIGDHFSHKTAVTIGHLSAAAGLIALGVGGGFLYSALCLVIAALGVTLVSGSDTALTYALSKDFKKDETQVKLYATVTIVLATTLGPLLALVHMGLPFILTGIFNVVAACLVLSIKSPSPKSGESNVFRTALKSLTQIRQYPRIGHLLFVSAVTFGFIISLKWLYNPLLEAMHIPLEYWGIAMGLALLAPMVGVRLYQRAKMTHIVGAFLLFLVTLVPIGIIQLAALSLIAMYIAHMLWGYLEIALDVALNHAIQTAQRASILSLGSLLSRLVGGAYLPIAGLTLQHASFLSLMIGTAAGLLILCGLSLLYLIRDSQKSS